MVLANKHKTDPIHYFRVFFLDHLKLQQYFWQQQYKPLRLMSNNWESGGLPTSSYLVAPATFWQSRTAGLLLKTSPACSPMSTFQQPCPGTAAYTTGQEVREKDIMHDPSDHAPIMHRSDQSGAVTAGLWLWGLYMGKKTKCHVIILKGVKSGVKQNFLIKCDMKQSFLIKSEDGPPKNNDRWSEVGRSRHFQDLCRGLLWLDPHFDYQGRGRGGSSVHCRIFKKANVQYRFPNVHFSKVGMSLSIFQTMNVHCRFFKMMNVHCPFFKKPSGHCRKLPLPGPYYIFQASDTTGTGRVHCPARFQGGRDVYSA